MKHLIDSIWKKDDGLEYVNDDMGIRIQDAAEQYNLIRKPGTSGTDTSVADNNNWHEYHNDDHSPFNTGVTTWPTTAYPEWPTTAYPVDSVWPYSTHTEHKIHPDTDHDSKLIEVKLPVENIPMDKLAAWFIGNDVEYQHLGFIADGDKLSYSLGLYNDEDHTLFLLTWM